MVAKVEVDKILEVILFIKKYVPQKNVMVVGYEIRRQTPTKYMRQSVKSTIVSCKTC